jgi:hypothetical protein
MKRKFNKLSEPIEPEKLLSFEELGLDDRETIELAFWNTSNLEVVEAIRSWISTCDCSKLSVKQIKEFCEVELIVRADSFH